MNADLQELAEKYVRTWDARAEGGLVDEVMAPDVVDHHPVGAADGLEGVKRDIAAYHSAFPDLTLTYEDSVITEDKVAVRWSATGTHEGDGLGLPPRIAECICMASTSCASPTAACRSGGESSTGSR